MLATTQALVNIEGGANSQLLESGSYSRYIQDEDVFLQLPTSFGKSVCYAILSFACLTERGSYAVVLVILRLVSL